MVGDSTGDASESTRVVITDGGEDEGDEDEDEDEGNEAAEMDEDGEDEAEGSTVLHLDLEGLFLNLLGLEVDLDEVELDVSAVPGEKRLLGNLLDAVAGLLDEPSLPDIGGKVDDAESKVTGELRDVGREVWDELDLAELITDVLRGLVNRLVGDSVDLGEGNGGEGSETVESGSEDEEGDDEGE